MSEVVVRNSVCVMLLDRCNNYFQIRLDIRLKLKPVEWTLIEVCVTFKVENDLFPIIAI